MAGSVDILEATLLPPEGGVPAPVVAPRRERLVVLLSVALAACLAALGVLGVRAYLSGRHESGQAGALELVGRYTAALDRHDLAGVRAELDDRAAFAAGENLQWPVAGPYWGDDLDAFYGRLFHSGLRIATTGPVEVTGSGPYQVTAVQTVRYVAEGVPVTEQAVSLYTVVTTGGRQVVREQLWWRQLHAPQPSMAWAQ